jgi:hypothetical protein
MLATALAFSLAERVVEKYVSSERQSTVKWVFFSRDFLLFLNIANDQFRPIIIG